MMLTDYATTAEPMALFKVRPHTLSCFYPQDCQIRCAPQVGLICLHEPVDVVDIFSLLPATRVASLCQNIVLHLDLAQLAAQFDELLAFSRIERPLRGIVFGR
jgi:hypothetical protein